MGDLVAILVAMLVVPGVFATWLTLRMDGPGAARWLAVALGAAAIGFFLGLPGQEENGSLTGFVLSLVFALPAALGTLVGSVVGSFMLLYSRK